MRVSKLIKALEDMKDSYGDLQISLSMAFPKNDEDGIITENESIFLGYDQFEDHDEINIRTFPY